MMKRIVALLMSAAMLLAFASCGDETDGDRKESGGAQSQNISSEADEGMTAVDAYDLYTEAVIKLAEETAYDMSVHANVTLAEDNTMTVKMEYQSKETEDDGECYSMMDLNNIIKTGIYYSNGVMHTVNEGALVGDTPVVTEEAITYDEFIEGNAGPASYLLSVELSLEEFDAARIEEKGETVEMTFTFGDITELPEQIASYTSIVGFDPATATDVSYEDAVITFEITTDGDLTAANIRFGASYTNEDGTPAEFHIDADMRINATGDDVAVETYTPAETPEEDPEE